MITVVSGSLLNVSAIIRSKKTLRIRRSKDPGGEGTIMSLSASHLSCRSTNKGEELKGQRKHVIHKSDYNIVYDWTYGNFHCILILCACMEQVDDIIIKF